MTTETYSERISFRVRPSDRKQLRDVLRRWELSQAEVLRTIFGIGIAHFAKDSLTIRPRGTERASR